MTQEDKNWCLVHTAVHYSPELFVSNTFLWHSWQCAHFAAVWRSDARSQESVLLQLAFPVDAALNMHSLFFQQGKRQSIWKGGSPGGWVHEHFITPGCSSWSWYIPYSMCLGCPTTATSSARTSYTSGVLQSVLLASYRDTSGCFKAERVSLIVS